MINSFTIKVIKVFCKLSQPMARFGGGATRLSNQWHDLEAGLLVCGTNGMIWRRGCYL